MRRREFITLLGGAAAAWPLAARAQQPGKLPIIGYLGAGTPTTERERVAALTQRLHQLGWIEGRTIAIESSWAEGLNERATEIAAEFVRRNVDIIVSSGTPPNHRVEAGHFGYSDRLSDDGGPGRRRLGSVSLARPGSNVTGLSLLQPDLGGKRLEVLREAVPGLQRLAVMGNFSNPPIAEELREVQAAAGRLGVKVAEFELRRAEDIRPAFDALNGRADALYIANDQLILSNRTRINISALAARLPTVYNSREYVEQGGLVSYGPNFVDLFRRAAEYVDKILRGAKPGDLPVEQPTKFDLVINLITAKALGLEIPPTLLARADKVIE
jgi:putative ABC transport system substrate-binding protein